MEHIDTWIHRNYYVLLERKAKKMGATKYKVAQQLIEKGLDEHKTHETNVTIAYWFTCYALVVATVLLVLL